MKTIVAEVGGNMPDGLVLLIDDDSDVRESLAKLLESLDFEVDSLANGNGVSELGLNGSLGDCGIFDDVVQHGSHQALMVHMHFAKNSCNGKRVGYIGLATVTELTFVGLFRIKECTADVVDLIFAEIVRQPS